MFKICGEGNLMGLTLLIQWGMPHKNCNFRSGGKIILKCVPTNAGAI
jgi:hypothetical protein